MLICTERVTLSLFELKNPCWQLRKADTVNSGRGNDAKLSHPSHSSGSSPSLSPVVGMEDLSPSPQTCFISLHYTFLHKKREQVEMRMQTTATKGMVILTFFKLGNQKIS